MLHKTISSKLCVKLADCHRARSEWAVDLPDLQESKYLPKADFHQTVLGE